MQSPTHVASSHQTNEITEQFTVEQRNDFKTACFKMLPKLGACVEELLFN